MKCTKCGEQMVDYYGCINKDCDNYWQKLEQTEDYIFCPECGQRLPEKLNKLK